MHWAIAAFVVFITYYLLNSFWNIFTISMSTNILSGVREMKTPTLVQMYMVFAAVVYVAMSFVPVTFCLFCWSFMTKRKYGNMLYWFRGTLGVTFVVAARLVYKIIPEISALPDVVADLPYKGMVAAIYLFMAFAFFVMTFFCLRKVYKSRQPISKSKIMRTIPRL